MATTKRWRAPKGLRNAIYARDGFTCVYCGSDVHALSVDHVVPQSAGGTNLPANLVTSCMPCNEFKAGWPADLYAILLEREGRGNAAEIMARVYNAVAKPLPEME